MKLYYARNSRAVRVAWLLEELGLSYEIESFELGSSDMRSDTYRALHPMGRVPTLVDGDITLYESGAILQYLLAKYGAGKFIPDINSAAFAVNLQWFHYAEGMIMPPMNTIVAICSSALSALYLQTLSAFCILFFYHTLMNRITIYDPVGVFGMFLLAWVSGIGVGMIFKAATPWQPEAFGIVTTLYARANMIFSGKMFLGN